MLLRFEVYKAFASWAFVKWASSLDLVSLDSIGYSKEELNETSTGGPPTTVTWRRNGELLIIDETTYQQSQRVVDRVRATCNISNIQGTDWNVLLNQW